MTGKVLNIFDFKVPKKYNDNDSVNDTGPQLHRGTESVVITTENSSTAKLSISMEQSKYLPHQELSPQPSKTKRKKDQTDREK